MRTDRRKVGGRGRRCIHYTGTCAGSCIWLHAHVLLLARGQRQREVYADGERPMRTDTKALLAGVTHAQRRHSAVTYQEIPAGTISGSASPAIKAPLVPVSGPLSERTTTDTTETGPPGPSLAERVRRDSAGTTPTARKRSTRPRWKVLLVGDSGASDRLRARRVRGLSRGTRGATLASRGLIWGHLGGPAGASGLQPHA